MTDALIKAAVAAIRARTGDFRPRIGIVTGSGLGAALDAVDATARLPYGGIPGFPVSTVPGHAGELLLGRLGGQPVACLNGRVHAYEGHALAAFRLPLRCLRALGCERVILVSTVGSINPEIRPGRMVLVRDHINVTGFNPLAGANDVAVGPRFPAMVDAYDPDLRLLAMRAASGIGLALAEGVMVHNMGPSFETPAEIRAARLLGGDLVGMSMAPEAIIARHCGLKVLGIAVVTNMGAGLVDRPPTHEETLAGAASVAGDLVRLLGAIMEGPDAPA
jgi:xanthosine phosphorylase